MSKAIKFLENFEGGSNGATITTSNTAFNVVSGGGTFTFDNTHAAAGVLSAKVTSDGAAGDFVNLRYTLPTSQSIIYLRMAVYLESLPPGTLTVGSNVNTGTNSRIGINSDGTVGVRNGNLVVGTSTNSVPTNQWFTLEWNVNASNSLQSAKIYTTLTGSPVETISPVAYTQGISTAFIVGIASTLNASVWFDLVALAYDDWIGPPSDTPTVGWLSA